MPQKLAVQMHKRPDSSRRLAKKFEMMPFSKPENVHHLNSARLDIPYYGIIRSKNNSTQLKSQDIHTTHDHMTSSVIPSLMADGLCDVDTRAQYTEMLMSASRTQKQMNKTFDRLLTHTPPSIAR